MTQAGPAAGQRAGQLETAALEGHAKKDTPRIPARYPRAVPSYTHPCPVVRPSLHPTYLPPTCHVYPSEVQNLGCAITPAPTARTDHRSPPRHPGKSSSEAADEPITAPIRVYPSKFISTSSSVADSNKPISSPCSSSDGAGACFIIICTNWRQVRVRSGVVRIRDSIWIRRESERTALSGLRYLVEFDPAGAVLVELLH